MKRQRSRNRSSGSGSGSGGKPQHNANRAFESNGPDGVKIRGAAQHVFEKYQQLARDALTAGDRVLAESYQQHAEHYFRLLRAVQPQRTAADIIGRDAFTSGYDIDFEDETGNANETEASSEASEPEGDRGEWRNNENRGENRGENRYEGRDRQRDDRPRDERPRDDKPREDRQQRDDRPRNFNRDDRPRNFSRDDRPRDDRPAADRSGNERSANDRPREDRPAREDRPRYDRAERPSDPLPVIEPQASPLTGDAETSGSPFLRSHDGGVSHAPAFLQARPETRPEPAAEDGEAKPRARRRRAPRTFEGAAGEEGASSTGADASEDA